MPHITGHDRSQTLLLPEALEYYVAQDNPVRFIEAFEGLDLTEAGFADVEPKPTGRSGYAPGVWKLSDPVAVHAQQLSCRVAAEERGGAGIGIAVVQIACPSLTTLVSTRSARLSQIGDPL